MVEADRSLPAIRARTLLLTSLPFARGRRRRAASATVASQAITKGMLPARAMPSMCRGRASLCLPVRIRPQAPLSLRAAARSSAASRSPLPARPGREKAALPPAIFAWPTRITRWGRKVPARLFSSSAVPLSQTRIFASTPSAAARAASSSPSVPPGPAAKKSRRRGPGGGMKDCMASATSGSPRALGQRMVPMPRESSPSV